MDTCPSCGSPLMNIDHHGELLVGCLACNRWGHPGDKKLTLEMVEDDWKPEHTSGKSIRRIRTDPSPSGFRRIPAEDEKSPGLRD